MRFRTVLPRSVFNIVNIIQDVQKGKEPALEPAKRGTMNEEGFFKETRIIDPVFACAYYGLYDSLLLPPQNSETYLIEQAVAHDFGSVDISILKKNLNNLVFALWIIRNGLPTHSGSIEYRKNLYGFLKELLNDDYFVNVTLPFYLDKAVKSKMNFVDKLENSNRTEYASSDNSPELIGLTFKRAQEKFYQEVFSPDLVRTQKKGSIPALIKNGENEAVEFKSSAFWSTQLSAQEIENRQKATKSKELADYGKNASRFIIAKSIAGFLNSNGGSLVIGVVEDKQNDQIIIKGIEEEYAKVPDHNQDGYRRQIIDTIINRYFYPDFFNHLNKYLTISFEEVEGVTVCWIKINRSDQKIFVKAPDKGHPGKEKDIFFIRVDAETREIFSIKEIMDYCQKRFSAQDTPSS